MLNIGPQELLIILIIALIVVGPQRLPSLGRSIGRSLRELRNAQDEVKRTIRLNLDEPPNGSSAGAPAGAAGPSARPASGSGMTPGATARGSIPSAVAGAAPTASEPLPADEVREISRSLGKSLAELRRAKEEVQRSFRIDLSGPSVRKPTRAAPGTPTPKPAPEPSGPDTGGHAPSTTEGSSGAESAVPDRATD
jgi:sec-independent protein translocase protein TatA